MGSEPGTFVVLQCKTCGALSEGDLNTAEVLNGLTYRLDEILAIVDEIIAVRK